MVKDKTLPNFDKELADIQSRTAETLSFLETQGHRLNLAEWVTIAKYAQQHNLSTQVVTNWINRGKIPHDCVIEVPELNNLRLIKDQTY
ncbi:hypothetical protein GCM10023189_30350 [Nibrella saemangeumensis]|uniref:Helix-turn-helix domain-containing protein n=1 Tax=Nibrella saemangeumensis TaxID=1084526 RepID=A0ABP8N1J4_9BACT